MSDFDMLAPNYLRSKERWPEADTLSKSYDALSSCFDGNAHGMVEQIKSYIETVCITIVLEFGQVLPPNANTTGHLVSALKALGMENTRGASSLDSVLTGFNKLADALTAMRNESGPVAHGRDGFLDAVSADHARAFLHTGDAILSVLLNALEAKEPDLAVTREPYDRFSHLNNRIDQAVGVEARVDEDGLQQVLVLAIATGTQEEAIELRLSPSKLLYGVDRLAYVEILRTAAPVVDGEGDFEDEEPAAIVEPPNLAIGPSGSPVTTVVGTYKGTLASLRSPLDEFLAARGLPTSTDIPEEPDLNDSLLATAEENTGVDWKRRETLHSRLKIASKRILYRFPVPHDQTELIAEEFVKWLLVNAPDDNGSDGATA